MTVFHRGDDPHRLRESEKYANPVPSREYILQYLETLGKPAGLEDVLQGFQLSSEEDTEALRRRLRAMERDGQLVRTRRGDYGIVKKMDLVRGRVIGHRDGFGFLSLEQGGDDWYLSAHEMRGLLHGDKILARLRGLDRRGRKEAAVVEILEDGLSTVVGRYNELHQMGSITPDDKRINHDFLVPPEERMNAKDGQMVVARLIARPTAHTQALVRIVEVLGDHMAPGMEIDVAIRNHNLPHTWSQDVLDEVASLSEEVSSTAKQDRVDLRHLPFVTIDGADAKDFDDAVLCEKAGKNWRLWVAIADVSYYVRPDSALDKEAVTRGNSVYFPGQVIPMLPDILSNGLCSLKPEVDRLAMVCELLISSSGRITEYDFYPAIICSKARLTYTEVWQWLSANQASRPQVAAMAPQLQSLYDLYQILHQARLKRGAIEFEFSETQIVFGTTRKIEKIVPLLRNDAHRLIEECMICANVAAAEYLAKHQLPTVYRVHDTPDDKKLVDCRQSLAELGLALAGGKKVKVKPKDYAAVLEQVGDRPDRELIQMMLLRSLKQAVYAPDNVGHFGLALDTYTHFTSPIRRYADLLVHRGIKAVLRQQSAKLAGLEGACAYETEAMAQLGEQCSFTERRADDATRQVVDWLRCEFMRDKMGQEFHGTVSGVTAFGLFVRLDEVHVEGLVHVTSLSNDYYHYDPARQRLSGERTGQSFRFGDRLQVKVVRVDLDERKIDFDLIKLVSGKNTKKRKK